MKYILMYVLNYDQSKKDGGDDDSNGNNSNSTSRGNWWKGMIFCLWLMISDQHY